MTTTEDPERTGEYVRDPGRTITLPQAPGREARLRGAMSWILTVVVAVALTVVIKTWLLQVYSIPSHSMTPTLEVGDRVVVSKLERNPARGDVVVFERPTTSPGRPGDPDVLIKRVIGLPGERISSRDGDVVVDGRVLAEDYLPEGTRTVIQCRAVWGECTGSEGEGFELVVPSGSYLVMGDNRGDSHDGREFGPIPADLIVGRGVLRVWPLSRLGGL